MCSPFYKHNNTCFAYEVKFGSMFKLLNYVSLKKSWCDTRPPVSIV